MAKGIILFCALLSTTLYSQEYFERFVDSANNHINHNSERALQFLELIPKPVENFIEGRLADYYSIKALIHDDYNQRPEVFQSYLLALKYGEIEKNYEVAGDASLEVFSNYYFINKDSTAGKYLEKAKKYYALSNYEYGNLAIEQTKAYIQYVYGEYSESNKLILENFEAYKSTMDTEAYYYLFAMYMLSSNYLYLDDLEKASKYFSELKTLKNNTTIVEDNYKSFESTLNSCFAEYFYKKKQIDSSLHYLSEASKYRETMREDAIKDYYTLYADIYGDLGQVNKSKVYLDSIKIFQETMHNNIVGASFQINDSILKAEAEARNKNIEDKAQTFRFFGGVLFIVIALISLIYFYFYKRIKIKLNHLNAQEKNLTYLKSNNEKLAVKVQGLEDYISSLKKEAKAIVAIDDVVEQKEKIKEYYKNLHLSSSTILDESNNYLELANDFDRNFFKELQELFPELNDSEIIICFYIYIGFKNKEIAVFQNTSIRAIESKRYRITKKMNLKEKGTTLVDFLRETFDEMDLQS